MKKILVCFLMGHSVYDDKQGRFKHKTLANVFRRLVEIARYTCMGSKAVTFVATSNKVGLIDADVILTLPHLLHNLT